MRGERIRENRQRWEEDEKILRGEDYLDATAVGDGNLQNSDDNYVSLEGVRITLFKHMFILQCS